MYAALTVYLQLALAASAVVLAALMFRPYVVEPIRRRWGCPHQGDVVVLKRSRYKAMLDALDALRTENAQLQEALLKAKPAPAQDEDEQTITRLEEWLKKQGAR